MNNCKYFEIPQGCIINGQYVVPIPTNPETFQPFIDAGKIKEVGATSKASWGTGIVEVDNGNKFIRFTSSNYDSSD